MGLEEMRKEDLQSELQRRDLPHTGTKAELIERLEQDGKEEDGKEGNGGAGSRSDLGAALAQATRAFQRLTRLEVEVVSRVEPVDAGTEATFEVVELGRVPRSTDVLASYDVDLDGDGNLTSWRRTRRYLRNQQEDM